MRSRGRLYSDRHQSDIGLRKLFPRACLADYVQCIWAIASPDSCQVSRRKILYPDGGVGLVFNLGDPMSVNGERVSSRSFFDGARLTAAQLRIGNKIHALGIRFKPVGAFALLGIPPGELPHGATPIVATDLTEVDGLHEILQDAGSIVAQMQILETWITRRLDVMRRCSPLVVHAARNLDDSGGQVTVRDLSRSLDVSPRQLERLFSQQVGMSPKRMARLIRVRRAKEMLKQKRGASCTEVGYLTGYFDQAHFIRDFTSIVGLTPMAYLGARRRQASGAFETR